MENLKNYIENVLIEKVSNGYVVYQNTDSFHNKNSAMVIERKVFETQESLFKFLYENI
jgi:hypothetical protein